MLEHVKARNEFYVKGGAYGPKMREVIDILNSGNFVDKDDFRLAFVYHTGEKFEAVRWKAAKKLFFYAQNCCPEAEKHLELFLGAHATSVLSALEFPGRLDPIFDEKPTMTEYRPYSKHIKAFETALKNSPYTDTLARHVNISYLSTHIDATVKGVRAYLIGSFCPTFISSNKHSVKLFVDTAYTLLRSKTN